MSESSPDNPIDITLSVKEVDVIKSLERLAKKWPKSLELFGWAGTLIVLKKGHDGIYCSVGNDFNLRNIRCDGGDPSDEEVHQFVNISYQKKVEATK